MPEKARPVIALILICALAGSAYFLYKRFYASESSLIEATGTIEATRVNLHAKNSGTIRNFSIKDGEGVKNGQAIATLERNDLLAQRERDAMNLLAAESKLRELESGAREQEIKSAQASVNLAQINFDQANKDLERIETLYNNGAASASQLENAQSNAGIREQQLAAAQAQLDLLQAGSKAEQIAAAQAQVKSSRAVLQASEALVADLKVISPLDGVVSNRAYENGEFVQAGSSLLTVTDLNNLWIKVYIPTDELPGVKLNQTVKITVSGSSQVFTGQVREIATQGEYTPKTIQTKKERTNVVYAVKITVDNPEGILKPGMPADVVFDRS